MCGTVPVYRHMDMLRDRRAIPRPIDDNSIAIGTPGAHTAVADPRSRISASSDISVSYVLASYVEYSTTGLQVDTLTQSAPPAGLQTDGLTGP